MSKYIILLSILALCSSVGAWTTPVPVSGVNTQAGEGGAFLSSDELTLYFTRGGTDTPHYYNQLYQATRSSLSGSFSNAAIISELACDEHETNSWVLPGNVDMYFARTWQIRESTRANTTSQWGQPQYLTSLNDVGPAANPKVSTNELSIVFNVFPDYATGVLYTASRNNAALPFTNIRALTELNTSADTRTEFLSADGLALYFGRNDSGIWHNYESTRTSIDGTFGTAQLLSFPDNYGLSWLSADGKTAYLGYNGDIYVSQIPEPATLALFAMGAIMLRRSRK